jgi:hypothetical protein
MRIEPRLQQQRGEIPGRHRDRIDFAVLMRNTAPDGKHRRRIDRPRLHRPAPAGSGAVDEHPRLRRRRCRRRGLRPPAVHAADQQAATISAITLNEVNSDLPGDVVAIVTEDVRDTPTGRHVLIPAAAKLYGRYNTSSATGSAGTRSAGRELNRPNTLIIPQGPPSR